jgi:hypothetical protein
VKSHPQPKQTALFFVGLTYFAAIAAVPQTVPREQEPALSPPAAADPILYRIDSTRTSLQILVYRDGPLARLGHNHVISAHGISGSVFVRQPRVRSEFELSLPVIELTVDDPDARRAAGDDFSLQPSAADIEGTRENMLAARVLDIRRYPVITVSGRLVSAGEAPRLAYDISLKEQHLQGTLPITLTIQDDELTVDGSLELSHADLGLEPFRVMMGALRVADVLTLRFHVTATRQQ